MGDDLGPSLRPGQQETLFFSANRIRQGLGLPDDVVITEIHPYREGLLPGSATDDVGGFAVDDPRAVLWVVIQGATDRPGNPDGQRVGKPELVFFGGPLTLDSAAHTTACMKALYRDQVPPVRTLEDVAAEFVDEFPCICNHVWQAVVPPGRDPRRVPRVTAPVAGDGTAGWPKVNWNLIERLVFLEHKHLNVTPCHQYTCEHGHDHSPGTGEVLEEARTVQHLCDLAGVPEGSGYSAHIDARVQRLVQRFGEQGQQLARIAGWHRREAGPVGMVGDLCTECGVAWPCVTYRMADGSYTNDDDEAFAGADLGGSG